MPDQIPAGFGYNTPEQKAKLQDAVRTVFSKLLKCGSGIGAVACVFVMPDGTVTAALAADADTPEALLALVNQGPNVLQVTVDRMKEGKGETKIESVKEM